MRPYSSQYLFPKSRVVIEWSPERELFELRIGALSEFQGHTVKRKWRVETWMRFMDRVINPGRLTPEERTANRKTIRRLDRLAYREMQRWARGSWASRPYRRSTGSTPSS